MKQIVRLGVMVLALVLSLGMAVAAADVAVLMSDYTAQWYEDCGWDNYESDMQTIRDTLDLMGVSFVELSDADLAAGNFGDAKLLILPNNRRMSGEQVEATRQFLSEGGTLFALMQASFKDENDQTVGSLYQLGDVMGISYEAFGWKPPQHGCIAVAEADHPIFKGLPEFIKFHRNWAMVNKLNGGKMLAEWFNDDQIMPSHLPELNAAIVEGPEGNCIYVGEMIFMEEAVEEPAVQKLAMNIISYLLDKSTR